MRQLRQLNLQLAFKGAGTQCKDIQNQSSPIHNPALEKLLKVFLLAWTEMVIDQHQFGTSLFDQCL